MSWGSGLAEWRQGNTVYLSVVFTYRLQDAFQRALFYQAEGLRVIAGGPALFSPKMQAQIEGVVEFGSTHPDAIAHHNPQATIASRGCPVGCWFCVVPKMEGREFTLLPDFPVRPILCDNNLSALPPEYQNHIISRYNTEDMLLRDANSGFEPVTFTDEVYHRWRPLVNAGGGPWRFAFDEQKERTDVLRVIRMLRDEPQSRKRVYVLIGNEPFDSCMERIHEIISERCEPHVQPFIKLNALEKRPCVRHDWTAQKLRDVARWANRFLWRSIPFADYQRSASSKRNHDDTTAFLWETL